MLWKSWVQSQDIGSDEREVALQDDFTAYEIFQDIGSGMKIVYPPHGGWIKGSVQNSLKFRNYI